MRTIEVSDEAFVLAERLADMDGIGVPTLVESLVRRNAEYIDMFLEMAKDRRERPPSKDEPPSGFGRE